jgi:hypothetical protein
MLAIKVFYLLPTGMGSGRFIGEHEAIFLVIGDHEAVVSMLVDDHLVVPAGATVLVISVSCLLLLTKMRGLVVIGQREAAVIMLVVDHFLVVAGSLMLVPLLVLTTLVDRSGCRQVHARPRNYVLRVWALLTEHAVLAGIATLLVPDRVLVVIGVTRHL